MTPKMGDLAARISAHLKRFEADPKINKRDPKRGITPYYHAFATYPGGPRLSVQYISFQGQATLTRDEAVRYLAKLDAGFVGRHYEALR